MLLVLMNQQEECSWF
uniref:Uncharacterized protein n=1 Tax=Rhizophora mucronata TaxID=61149 RepID=A0A2P2NWV9_RHIMU